MKFHGVFSVCRLEAGAALAQLVRRARRSVEPRSVEAYDLKRRIRNGWLLIFGPTARERASIWI